jgi:hypothetical protein
MLKLEDLRPSASVRGLIPDSLVTVVNVQALSYNGLVQRWAEINRLAREEGRPRNEQIAHVFKGERD